MSPQAPKCPWCAKPMTYVRTTPAKAGRQKHRYECKRCIVLYEELDRNSPHEPERVRWLHTQPVHTLQ